MGRLGLDMREIMYPRNETSTVSSKSSHFRCIGNLKTVESEATTHTHTHKIPSRKQSCQDMSESLFIIDLFYKIWILFPYLGLRGTR